MSADYDNLDASLNISFHILEVLFPALIGHGCHQIFQDQSIMRNSLVHTRTRIPSLESRDKVLAEQVISFFERRYTKS